MINVETLALAKDYTHQLGNGLYDLAVTKFVVSLTVTNPDNLSGEMDKTVSEIEAAWYAGKKIFFAVSYNNAPMITVPLSNVQTSAEYEYSGYGAYVVMPSTDLIITVETAPTNDGSTNTYSTHAYSLNRLWP